MSVSKEFRIPEENYAYLEEKLAKINKRCKKLHLPPILLEITETIRHEGQDRIRHTYVVTVRGKTPLIEGHIFAGTVADGIEEDGKRFNMLKLVPEVLFPGEETFFLHTYQECDYCHQKRKRIDTYLLLRVEDRKVFQIGSKCLSYFLPPGSLDPHAIAAYAEMIMDAVEVAESSEAEDHSSHYIPKLDVEEYLPWVHASIRNFGWWSRKRVQQEFVERNTTARDALYTMDQQRNPQFGGPRYTPEEQDKEETTKALTWIRSHNPEELEDNNYMMNLYVSCKGMMTDMRSMGTVASLFASYNAAMKWEYEKTHTTPSQWQGEIGVRATFPSLLVMQADKHEGDGYRFYAYKLIDAAGNKFEYNSNKELLQKGKTYDLIGTVAHKEWNGIKTTKLSRVKIIRERATV